MLGVSLVFGASAANAQETATAPHAIYLEVLGNGVLYSLNYERRFTPHISGRVGFMYTRAESEGSFSDDLAQANVRSSGSVWLVPLMINYLSGQGNNHFEAGVGVLLGSAELGTATLGYRYQRPDGGFVFRAGFTPVFNREFFLPWFGISVGRSF